MDKFPITLVGDNLGERHKYLNDLVNKTYMDNVAFESIQDLPEHSAIDRLFKIDLACKYKHVDYILKTLKDEDMLFVSRALKCTWLLQEPFINPTFLETKLYPHMCTTASNKMRQWIHLHLKDETKCQDFYKYYKNNNMDLALKFLPKSPVKFLLKEMKQIPFDKITPHLLKLLSERSGRAAKIYFHELKTGGKVNEKFIQNIQFLLKTQPKIYFYIIENFYLMGFQRLNKEATSHIMENHRNRFLAKQELYSQWILDLPTLAIYLNSEDVKNLIITLSKAKYLGNDNWFSYKFCEPLIKRIDIHEKNKLCERIFKLKDIGEVYKAPPYSIPPLAEKHKLTDTAKTDPLDWKDYDSLLKGPLKIPLLRGGGGGYGLRTTLKQLFDKYRFCSFKKTFTELKKCILKVSQSFEREGMLLVLVSKTGGRAESLETLLRWIEERFSNEPCTVRAAVVRSLVKRAASWRLPDSTWSLLLKFGHDLGLDGRSPDANCLEGLHCVVLRHILLKNECPPEVWAAFLNDFSSLNEYALNADERKIVSEQLPKLLLNSIQAKPNLTEIYLTRLCDVLDAYRLRIDACPEALTAITAYVSRNPVAAHPLLRRLFKSRVACKTFFAHYFIVIQTDASYMNALRHNAKILESRTELDKLLTNNIDALHHERFFRKLAVYFGEKGGLAEHYLALLLQKAEEQPHWRLARPIAHLSGACQPLVDAHVSLDELQQRSHRKMVQMLQQNAHLQRPKRCPIGCNHESKNPYAIAHWIHTCSPVALQRELPVLLAHGRTARLVMALRAPADRRLLAEALPHAARFRAMRALRIALRILRRHPCDHTLSKDWTAIKSILKNIDLKGKKFEVYIDLAKLNDIPKKIGLEYCIALYEVLSRVGYGPASELSYRIALPLLECIFDHWARVDELLIQNILKNFLKNDFTDSSYGRMLVDCWYWRNSGHDYRIRWPNMTQMALDGDYYNYVIMHLRFLTRFLFSSESMWIQTIRIRREYLKPFLTQVKELWKYSGMQHIFVRFLKLLNCKEIFVRNSDCLETLKAVRTFCDEIAPMHTKFELYYRIRHIILYQCTVKQIMERRPDIFKGGEIVKNQEFDELLPFYFGQSVAEDLEKMVTTHFQSIRMFYYEALETYMTSVFGDLGSIHMINGIISDRNCPKVNAAVIGAMLFNKCVRHKKLNANESRLRGKLFNSLKSLHILEVKFFLYCNDVTILENKNCSFWNK